jgi:hypothetical protein
LFHAREKLRQRLPALGGAVAPAAPQEGA